MEPEKFRKISAAFRQRLVLCKTGYDFFKHSNSVKKEFEFVTSPGADVIKISNTPTHVGRRPPKALNPLKAPASKVKNSVYSSIPVSFPRTGADSQDFLTREEDTPASRSPKIL